MEYGRYYEELEVGATYRHWPGRTVSEYDNTLFALVSMNQNPLFLDEEYARTQASGRRPVIDTLVFSLTVGMSVADMTGKAIANLGYDSVIFERPLQHQYLASDFLTLLLFVILAFDLEILAQQLDNR